MRHQKKKKILSRPKASRKALFRNLAVQLILYEKIKTTERKSKELRSVVEKLITQGKQNSLTVRRQLITYLPNKKAVLKILEELKPRYKTRKGGYTRIRKLGIRQGDGAKICQIELV